MKRPVMLTEEQRERVIQLKKELAREELKTKEIVGDHIRLHHKMLAEIYDMFKDSVGGKSYQEFCNEYTIYADSSTGFVSYELDSEKRDQAQEIIGKIKTAISGAIERMKDDDEERIIN